MVTVSIGSMNIPSIVELDDPKYRFVTVNLVVSFALNAPVIVTLCLSLIKY